RARRPALTDGCRMPAWSVRPSLRFLIRTGKAGGRRTRKRTSTDDLDRTTHARSKGARYQHAGPGATAPGRTPHGSSCRRDADARRADEVGDADPRRADPIGHVGRPRAADAA